DPADPATDVGPVIDEDAKAALEAHLERLGREAKVLHRITVPAELSRGVFFGPVLAEIPSAAFLEREVFGPILHVVRYDPERLEEAAGALAAGLYGLPLGWRRRLHLL